MMALTVFFLFASAVFSGFIQFVLETAKRYRSGIMSSRTRIMLVIAVLFVAWAGLENAVAQKASVPKPQDNRAIGEPDVRKLPLLMDTDKNGKVSKETFMMFMEEEFERLDKNKTGELDPQELNQTSPRAKHVGK
jgi:hypothetical protein